MQSEYYVMSVMLRTVTGWSACTFFLYQPDFTIHTNLNKSNYAPSYLQLCTMNHHPEATHKPLLWFSYGDAACINEAPTVETPTPPCRHGPSHI